MKISYLQLLSSGFTSNVKKMAQKNLLPWTLIFFSTYVFPANAQNTTQYLVESIRSVEKVKQEIRETIKASDECSVGSCFNGATTYVCELVAALDVKVNGQIVQQMWSGEVGSPGEIAISSEDLNLMRVIFSQCKPTNYQYWNWDSMLHVSYLPSPEADRQIRAALEIPQARRY